ncbi:MAG: tetratricopeptide repeat protein [Candidatus Sungbacteria bacterium]|nr:tetratricopeptide repeat protein [Candidatus Sungbacteria bacterium]
MRGGYYFLQKLKKSIFGSFSKINWRVWIVAAGMLLVGFLFSRDALARFVWQKYRLPAVASFLMRHDAQLSVELGNYYFNSYRDGVYDLERAEKYFERALAIDPNVENAWYQLARIDFLRGEFTSARGKINKQLELHGDSIMASYYARGLINGYSGHFKEAEKDFLKFLSWKKESWAAHNDLAWVYFSQGEYKKAEEVAREGLAFNGNNVWLLNSLGVSLLNLGKKAEAREIFLRAREAAALLTDVDWGRAYPGNDPRSAAPGLAGMKKAIDANLKLLN